MPQEQAGELDYIMGIQENFQWRAVYSTKQAAHNLDLTHHYVTQLCDRGVLIATKINGRYWLENQWYKNRRVDGLPF